MQIYTFMGKIFMILKASGMGLEKENHESSWLRSLLRHRLSWWSLLHLVWTFVRNFFFWGGGKLFLNIYISTIIQNSIVKFTWLSLNLLNIYGKDPRFNAVRFQPN